VELFRSRSGKRGRQWDGSALPDGGPEPAAFAVSGTAMHAFLLRMRLRGPHAGGAGWPPPASGLYLGRAPIWATAVQAKVSLATLRLPARPGTRKFSRIPW